jgi:hypothetical protein
LRVASIDSAGMALTVRSANRASTAAAARADLVKSRDEKGVMVVSFGCWFKRKTRKSYAARQNGENL